MKKRKINRKFRKLLNRVVYFPKVLVRLIFGLSFIMISVVGNFFIWGFSYLFYRFEAPTNPNVTDFMDAVWWAYTTASTVGYGDIVPITVYGKLVGVSLMFVGIAIFAGYTAYFARAVVEDEEHSFRKYTVNVPIEKLRKELLDIHFLIDKTLQNISVEEDESD